MRVLLIASNRHDRLQSRMNAQPMPIGLAYIAGHMDHDRHQVKVLDLMFSDDPERGRCFTASGISLSKAGQPQ